MNATEIVTDLVVHAEAVASHDGCIAELCPVVRARAWLTAEERDEVTAMELLRRLVDVQEPAEAIRRDARSMLGRDAVPEARRMPAPSLPRRRDAE